MALSSGEPMTMNSGVNNTEITTPTPEATSVAPEPLGRERKLKDVRLENLVDPKDATFRLKQTTEDTFSSHVERHFRTFQGVTGRAAWQDSFISVFQRQVEAAAGNRAFDTIPEDERDEIITVEARKFVAETRNLQAVLGITRFNAETLQKVTRARVTNDLALARTVHEPARRTVSGGTTHDRYTRGANWGDNLVGLAARKLIGARPIGISDRFNDKLQDAGLPRIESNVLLTATEAARRASDLRKASNERTTNKTSDIHVEFPAAGFRNARFAGLSASEVALAHSYGLNNLEDYEESGAMGAIEKDLLDMAEARVDFYTATDMDIAKVQIDFNPAVAPQGPHTSIEHVVNRIPGLTLAQEVARTNEQAMQAAEQNLLRRLREGYTREKLEQERRIVEEAIEALGRPKTDAEVQADKAALEDKKKQEQERKERALAHEALKQQRDEAIAAAKAVDNTYATPADAKLDYDAYDTWGTDKKTLADNITTLQTEQAQYTVTMEAINKLVEERATLLKQLGGFTETEVDDGKGVKTTKSTPKDSITAITNRLEDIKTALENREYSLAPVMDPATGSQKLDTAGNPVFYTVEDRLSQIAAQLVRDQARLVSMQDGPVGWDAERTARVKSKKDNDALVARINIQITNGLLPGGGLEADSSDSVQKSIDALQERIDNVSTVDEYQLHRREAYIGVRDHMFSAEARSGFRDRVAMLRMGPGNLPMPRAEFYRNWPDAHIRIIQGIFGNEAIERPDIFQRVSRILTPERAVELYNQLHGGVITDIAAYRALPPGTITAQDLQYIWDNLHDDAVESRDLALVDDDEQDVLRGFKTVDALPATAKTTESVVQELERDHFHYRDLSELQLQILIDWAQKDGVALNSYLLPNSPANKDKIQWAALYAQDVDKRRKQRLAQAYGNPVAPPAPAVPPPAP